MDVSICSSIGVPDDAFVSVRAGTIRKQAIMSSGKQCKPFRFPTGIKEENRLKFDVLQRIGSGYAVLRTSDGKAGKYNVEMSSSMSCEIMVEETGAAASPLPAAPPDEALKSIAGSGAKAKDAKEYLEKTGLLHFLQGVLHVVLKERPEDPYQFIGKYFNSGYSAQQGEEPAAGEDATAPTEVPAPAPAPEAPAAPAHEEPPALPAAPEEGAPEAPAPADQKEEAAPPEIV